MPTINDAVSEWLESVRSSRSAKTYETYKSTSRFFLDVLNKNGIDGDSTVDNIQEKSIVWMISALHGTSVKTEQARVISIRQFYKFCIAEYDISFQMPKVESFVKQRGRRAGKRIKKFNRSGIDSVIDGIQSLKMPKKTIDRLILARDRAFIVTLADTGLRVHEACKLTRGMIDWKKRYAALIGKGDKEGVIRFTNRSLSLMKSYLDMRAKLDGQTGKPLADLPIFARHDDGAGDKILPITTTTGRNIVNERVSLLIGNADPRITPHSFRHWFITRIYETTGDLNLAKEMARHTNIETTGLYAHLSDSTMDSVYNKAMEGK